MGAIKLTATHGNCGEIVSVYSSVQQNNLPIIWNRHIQYIIYLYHHTALTVAPFGHLWAQSSWQPHMEIVVKLFQFIDTFFLLTTMCIIMDYYTTRSKHVKCVWKVCEMYVRSHVKHICEIKLFQNLSSFTCIWNTILCVKLKGKTFNLQLGMWNNMCKKNVDFYMWNYHVKKKHFHCVKAYSVWAIWKKYVKLNI